LYDLQADPWELENLAAKPEEAGLATEMRHRLRRRLLDWVIGSEDPRPVPLYYDLETFESSEAPRYWRPEPT
jgi:hypothetical protein